MDGLEGVIDLSDQLGNEVISVNVPDGKYVFYALVKVNAFASVINGAPGAAGPILNHMDKQAVNKYLHHMSDTIQAKTGPLSAHIRSMFTDSMELEGCNWATDILEEFKAARVRHLPYLPFMMFKVGLPKRRFGTMNRWRRQNPRIRRRNPPDALRLRTDQSRIAARTL